MKKILSLTLILVMALSMALLAGCGKTETQTLNVYNWGEYISDGSEDSLDTIKAFESWYEQTYKKKVKVNYSTFASNEDMYAKLSSGAVSYDVIFPSDYMIARLAAENMLLKLNFDNIPNYKNINESFRGLYYDPDDVYSVPFTTPMLWTKKMPAAGICCGTTNMQATFCSSTTAATHLPLLSTSLGLTSIPKTAPHGTMPLPN